MTRVQQARGNGQAHTRWSRLNALVAAGIKNTFNNVPLAAEFKGSIPERQVMTCRDWQTLLKFCDAS